MIRIKVKFFNLLWLIPILLISHHSLFSQYYFERELKTPVSQNNQELRMPWVGGLNGIQYSQMDLNKDGQLDLIAYDRSTEIIHCFLNDQGTFIYAPEFNNIFPPQISNFLQLADFNQDGKLDLFTTGNLGIIAYENVSTGASFQWEKVSNFLTYESSSGNEVNLQLIFNDYPHIADLDQDGDIDILNFNSSGLNSRIIFYENRSVEISGKADINQLFEVNKSWGTLEECNCGAFTFNGDDCNPSAFARSSSHAGGKSIFTADLNKDAILELITSHQECRNLFSFYGAESGLSPIYDNFNSTLLGNLQTPDLVKYPNTMPLRNDENAISHLIVSPNLKAQIGIAADYKESNWLYQLNQNSEPELKTKAFLQEDMIDWGILSKPSFWDYDDDGDLDLFVSFTNTDNTLNIYSAIALYKNIGSETDPAFILEDEDFLSFEGSQLSNLLIQFDDINGDGIQDLAYQATEEGQNSLWIRFGNQEGNFNPPLRVDDVFIGFGYSFHFTPVFGSDKYDLLIGKSSGGLILYQNTSSSSSLKFQNINNSFLSIEDDFFRSSLKVTTSDIDNDQKTDLIVSDLSGIYKIYSDYLAGTGQYDTLSLPNQQAFFGQSNLLTTAKLYDPELPSIISGNLSGGLTILRNKIEYDKNTGISNVDFTLYPNPSTGKFNINLSKKATLSITSTNGKVVLKAISLNSGINELNLSYLRSGIYIISVVFQDGKLLSKKLLLN